MAFRRLQQLLAVSFLLLFLQAIFPAAILSFETTATKAPSSGQNADPLSEEEDEHGDAELKFFCEGQYLPLAIAQVAVAAGHEPIPDSHILEIPTPPPLT